MFGYGAEDLPELTHFDRSDSYCSTDAKDSTFGAIVTALAATHHLRLLSALGHRELFRECQKIALSRSCYGPS